MRAKTNRRASALVAPSWSSMILASSAPVHDAGTVPPCPPQRLGTSPLRLLRCRLEGCVGQIRAGLAAPCRVVAAPVGDVLGVQNQIVAGKRYNHLAHSLLALPLLLLQHNALYNIGGGVCSNPLDHTLSGVHGELQRWHPHGGRR